MKRLMAHLSIACRDETGSVTPILMIMATIMLISGLAFMSVSAFQADTVNDTMSHTQAKYYAEQAVRKALWRLENIDPVAWATWLTFNDSTSSASYDTTTDLITAVGHFGEASDTIRVTVNLEPETIQQQIGHVIVYKKSLVLGQSGTVTYPAGCGPLQVKAWRLAKIKHNNYKKVRKFVQGQRDLLHKYNGNQVFDSLMEDGIHYVNGNAIVKNGTTLTGCLMATGTISFSGTVTINAMQVPTTSPYYPAYLPAVAAMRTTNEAQDLEDETTDVGVSGSGNNLIINGLIFSRRSVNLSSVTITGLIIAKNVTLSNTYTVTYDSKYHLPPAPDVEVKTSYQTTIAAWSE